MNRAKRRFAQGFSLLEVLITVVILAFGLLGVALMMAVSIRQQHETRMHTLAVFVGEAMMDRMRANTIAVWNREYDGEYSAASPPDGADCKSSAPCDPAQLAARDGVAWVRELDEFLYGGTGTIACAVGSVPGTGQLVGAPPLDGYCDLTVAWQEVSRTDGAPFSASVSWRFIP